jgi:methylenetetrahydrofolate dehydrogenase (NADP+) / methenyltetrahydrofolate cyclohydrolase
MMQVLSGKEVKESVLNTLALEIAELKVETGRVPGLAVVLVGEDPASQFYVSSKKRACEQIGIKSLEYKLDAAVGHQYLADLIQKLNNNDEVNGILLQLPLPKGHDYDEDALLELISPDKDVDGFHPHNVGKLLLGLPTYISCTPYGCIKILEHYNISPEGKHVVIVGRSNIVGKPLAALMMQKAPYGNATVTVCHSRSKNLSEITKQADILVAAIGQPEFIKGDMMKEGAVVIDVGINRVDDPSTEKGYRIVGDVDYDKAAEKASAITPVPGGVGLMTIAMLMTNTVHAFKAKL